MRRRSPAWLLAVGGVALLASYFLFGLPPWVNTLSWPPGDPSFKRTALCLLELSVLLAVTLTNASIPATQIGASAIRRGIYLAAGAYAFGYGVFRIIHGHDSVWIRLFYSVFTLVVVGTWALNTLFIFSYRVRPLLRAIAHLDGAPNDVLTDGRHISLSVDVFAVQLFALVLPLLLWLPTLIPGLGPRYVGVAVGLVACCVLIVVPLYAQLRTASALLASLRNLDEVIAMEVVDAGRLMLHQEQVKALLDIREQLTKGVVPPFRTVLWPVLQATGAIAAFFVAVKALR
jgi:hypothetical protein